MPKLSLPFFALLLALPGLAGAAEKSVAVKWRVHFTTPDGPGIFSTPTASYLETLRRCGHEPDLRREDNYLPLSALRCAGVLDFAPSKSLRARVDARLRLVEKNGHRAAAGLKISEIRRGLLSLDFAISRFGVFFTQLDGIGTARFVGLNVAESKLVILNQRFWEQLTDVEGGDAFLLHEILGALDFEDTDYSRSNLLFQMSQAKHESGDGDEADDTRVHVAERGGASVVGRGGDSNQLFFKASLLKATEKQLQIEGADPRLTPTPAELRKVINATPISVAPAEFFNGKDLCQNPETGASSREYCGAFLLKGVDGRPFLLITRDWASFPDSEKFKLVQKIFINIVGQVVRQKQGK